MEGLQSIAPPYTLLRPDEWHLIARFCSIRDLCRLMRVSREWFYLWSADRAWVTQRNRFCDRFPALVALFEKYGRKGATEEHTNLASIKSNSNKKRKTAWITPCKGIWYVFQRWLIMGCDIASFKKLCASSNGNAAVEQLCFSVLRAALPHQERIAKCKMTFEDREYGFQFWLPNNNWLRIRVWRGRHIIYTEGFMSSKLHQTFLGSDCFGRGCTPSSLGPRIMCYAWKRFLFPKLHAWPLHTKVLDELMQSE